MITPDGNITQTQIDAFDSISSVPVYVVCSFEKNPYSASILYERSFMGGLHVVHDSGDEEFFPLDGLGFGSPDVVKTNNGFIAGFISQSGKVKFTNLSGSLPSQVSYDLEGVFYQNLRKCENSFIALSGDGYVYRIDMDYLSGELYKTGNISPEVWENAVSKIKIPYFTARKGEVFVCDFDLDGYEELFVCGDGNLIFGFRSNLEMIGNFPVTGYGKPLFVDLDGDNKNDAVTLSLDNKINAWHISY